MDVAACMGIVVQQWSTSIRHNPSCVGSALGAVRMGAAATLATVAVVGSHLWSPIPRPKAPKLRQLDSGARRATRCPHAAAP